MTIKKHLGIEHKIFDRDEADNLDIQYKHWKECKEVGDWMLTDDDCVMELLDIRDKTLERSGRIVVQRRSCWGWRGDLQKLYGKARRMMPSKPELKPALTGGGSERKGAWDRVFARMYVKMFLTKSIDFNTLGKYLDSCKVSRRREKYGYETDEHFVLRIINRENINSMVMQDIEQALSNVGISKESVLKLFIDAMDMAKEKKDITNYIRIGENLSKMVGLYPSQTVEKRNMVSMEYSLESIDNIEKKLVESDNAKIKELPEVYATNISEATI